MNGSELILSKSNEIYHLKLRPGDLAEHIITVGDPKRIQLIKPLFNEIELEKTNREFQTITGKMNGNRLSVISTGIGTDNIDIVFTEVDALFNIDFDTKKRKENLTKLHFYRIGTSGALQEDIAIGSIILSSFAIGLDQLLFFYDHLSDPQNANFAEELSEILNLNVYVSTGSATLLDQLSDLGTQGITVTCPGFYGPQGRHIRISPSKPKILSQLSQIEFQQYRITNFEMETAGIYALTEVMGHEAISINGILANRAKGTFASNPKIVEQDIVHRSVEAILSCL